VKQQDSLNSMPNHAVAVIGGGIAGIQSALDLAEGGYRVFLIERDISIGGNMARLDKTFPTNDCSTCMLSPKLLEVANHPNVTILTRTEVVSLEGSAGNFKLRVLRRPRYVIENRCTACGECEKVCPVDVPADFNMGMNERRAIYKHFPQAVPSSYAIDKTGISPCKAACPAGISVHGYVALIRRGQFREALKLIKKSNPFAAVCGRICHRPCEKACLRGAQDEPIAIRDLKRFVADLDLYSYEPYIPPRKEPTGKKVAIIGAGPGGLSAAYYLAIEGHDVTVFDAHDEPGGLLKYGIPSFRLPKEIVSREIDTILGVGGIELEMGVRWGKDFSLKSLKEDGYDAILIATGAQKPLEHNLPGENLKGVLPAIEFLKNPDKKHVFGKTVIVIGAGNTGFDAARTAIRLGAKKVTVLYRRSRKEIPAEPEEIEMAAEEGIRVEYLTGCTEIIGKDRVEGVGCIRMELSEPDESGRRRPIPIGGSEFNLEADTVIIAIGQRTDTSPIEQEEPAFRPALSRWGTIIVDPLTFETSVKGVFAAGDVVVGPSSVVQAVGTAKEAATSIDRFLRGTDLREGRRESILAVQEPFRKLPNSPRKRQKKIPPNVRKSSFDEVFLGLSREEVIAEASRCLDCGICSECGRCEEVCMAKAIDHNMLPEEQTLSVGAVIVTTGYQLFDPLKKQEYGYGRFANVITSLEYERLLSASGPTHGQVVLTSDGSHPQRIAWIQCIGSRDLSVGREYCSAVCCMYATKQAIVTKEHDPWTDTTVFFIDLRAMGKGFERYVRRAREHYGVRYIRASISHVVERPEDGKLEVTFFDEESNTVKTEVFDLVVLSLGIEPSAEAQSALERLGIATDNYGFAQTDPLLVTETNLPGVFVCGTAESPKDIPDSVTQASSAVASVQKLLLLPPSSEVETGNLNKGDFESEKIPLNPPRIGVFVCHCGINIAGVVDVNEVVKYAESLPGVVYSTDLIFACATDGTGHIVEAIREHKLNRVVVASCSPRTHEPLFQNALEKAGLNRYLFEMANIRDQCSWVHGEVPHFATQKAKNLVRMAVAKACFLEPIEGLKIPVLKRVLVVGGGPAGMTAALVLANQNIPVILIEKERELGGHAKRWLYRHPSGKDVQKFLQELIDKVTEHPLIEVHLGANIIQTGGRPGDFVSLIEKEGKRLELHHGATVVAIGAREYIANEYRKKGNGYVLSQREFHKALATNDPYIDSIRNVVMIQCIGSRDVHNSYCSRICCTTAVANAIWFKEKFPEAHVTILYRDMRTFGKRELLYLQARKMGVRFFRFDYEKDGYPEVYKTNGKMMVSFVDATLRESINLAADLVVLSTGVEPHEDHQLLSKIFKLSLDPDGFFLEAHPKLKPVETASAGIFLAGAAQGPKFLEECIDQAKAAAAKAAIFVSRGYMTVGGRIAVVDPSGCSMCLSCLRVCPYGAPSVTGDIASAIRIDPAICQGCGACMAECPARAIELQCFTDAQIRAKISAFCEEQDFLKVANE